MNISLSALHQARKTYRSIRSQGHALLHRAETAILAAVLLYKILTNLVFIPAMHGIWGLTLRFSPVNYLSNNNAHQIFTSPTILGGIVLIAVLAAFWTLYEFSLVLHGIDLARRGENVRMRPLFFHALADIRHAVLPRNWPVLFYCAVLIPFTDPFVTSNYITQLAVPEYLLGVIRAKPAYLALYLLIFAAAIVLTVCWVLVLPLFTVERKDFGPAVRQSMAWVRHRFFRLAALLVRWNIGVLLRAALWYLAAYALLEGAASLIGLQSTRAMLLFSRAMLTVELPFLGFLLECRIITAQCTLIGLLYDRTTDREPEPVPPGRRWRSGGRLLLAGMVCGVTLISCLSAWYLFRLPEGDALLTAVGGITPLVTFHRGDCTVAPENTIPAFRSAILKGGDRIELDVQMSKDGIPVVTHDTNLKRCTGKNAKVYDLTLAQIKLLDAGSWFSSRFTGTRIPTLEEVLRLCQGRIGLNVEIKPSYATPALEAETVRLLRNYGFDASNCVITSQSYECLCKVKELAPDFPTGYILALGVGNYYDLPAADFFSVENTFITSGMVNAVHLRGKTVSAWTIDRESDASHMLELGVDDLITDKPDMVRSLLAQNAKTDEELLSLRDLLERLLKPEAADAPQTDEIIEEAIEDPEELIDAA